MDEQPKKRRFWQLHLSTVIIAVIVAGVFIGFNAEERLTGINCNAPDQLIMEYSGNMWGYGWPAPFYEHNHTDRVWMFSPSPWNYSRLTIDAILLLGFVMLTIVFCEVVIALRLRRITVLVTALTITALLELNWRHYCIKWLHDRAYEQGWPMACHNSDSKYGWNQHWSTWPFVVDAVTGFAILLLIMFVVEFTVRRREGRTS